MTTPDLLSVLVYPLAPAPSGGHEYLLVRRTPTEGGFWQGVTGAVEPGEALDAAAIRELEEETRLTPVGLVPIEYQYTLSLPRRKAIDGPRRRTIQEHVFLALLEARVDPTIDPSQHDAWAWFRFEDAIRWLRWPENIEALRRCEDLVNRRL